MKIILYNIKIILLAIIFGLILLLIPNFCKFNVFNNNLFLDRYLLYKKYIQQKIIIMINLII
jgi:hypothetical protein